ncbi:hypothetical protein BG011_003430 [Mortierella polycephala]|uniref:Pentatricopeptide repeat-containing protein n=1 Tax=Mortierella polycephala TaxID=41804 RepID=A0A9P6U3N0_9FUNG|nr:hypothetical protein BG011_003430 [Mortierella polycephala]
MHSLQHLARRSLPTTPSRFTHCTACLERTFFARGLATVNNSPVFSRVNSSSSRNIVPSAGVIRRHPQAPSSSRFSTSSIHQSIKALSVDGLYNDIVNGEPGQGQQHKNSSSTDPSSSSIAGSLAEEPFAFGEDSKFLDSTIIPPEPIKAFRHQYMQIRSSNNPSDHEMVLATYRTLADDPELLAQLQPIDFMIALNSNRGLRHVIHRMRRILKDVEKTEHRQITDIYHILLKTYIRLSDFRGCNNLLEEMSSNRMPFNNATYHIMLDICKHEKDLWKAQDLLRKMRERNIEVTSSTYLIMLSICARVKNPNLAREYFNEMPLVGLEQDVTHYNTLLNAYAQARNFMGAHQVFELMEEDGIPPDQYTYAAMIKSMKPKKSSEEVQAMLNNFMKQVLKPNAKVLAALDKEPSEIVDECMRNGIEMGLNDFNMLLIRALRSNRFSQVPYILEKMQGHGHRPNVFTFTAMVDANIKMNKYQEAKEVFRAMEQANIQPDVIAYSAMIAGAMSHAGIQESMDILKAMIQDGLLPNQHTFNSLLSAGVGEIGVDALDTIRDTMTKLPSCLCRPDALTYSILITGFLQNGDLRYSMEWFFKMIDSGFVPAPFVFNSLMAALHGSGQGQQVMLLWQEMDRLRVRKNEQSYEIAREACEKYDLDARYQIEEEFKIYLAERSIFYTPNSEQTHK